MASTLHSYNRTRATVAASSVNVRRSAFASVAPFRMEHHRSAPSARGALAKAPR